MTNSYSRVCAPRSCTRRRLQLPTNRNRQDTNNSVAEVVDSTTHKLLINTIVGNLVNQKVHAKNHILSKNAYKNVIEQYLHLIPDLTTTMLKNRVYRLYKKHPLYKKYNISDVSKVPFPPPPASPTSNSSKTDTAQKKTGRPKGLTHESTRLAKINEAEAKDEITKQYFCELKSCTSAKKTKNGLFNSIVQDISSKRNLPCTFKFTYNAAMKRISRNNMNIPYNQKGPKSPLFKIEDDLVRLLILLGETGAPLTPPQVIRLTNSLIYDTPVQVDLVKWKRQNKCKGSDDELGRVGHKYYKNFMIRNKDKLKSKRGRRFELNREKWQTYTNFSKMYEDHEAEMVDAKIAEFLPTPVWMDKNGTIVSQEKSSIWMQSCN
jgi:hypothetical protein